MDIKDLLEFTDRSQLREWLEANHASAKECWVTTYRTKVPRTDSIPYLHVVEEALCFGWIDSTLKRLPDGRNAQRLSPRRKGSHWTELNRQRCADLEQRGLMTEAGREAWLGFILSERATKVLRYLSDNGIPYSHYTHPEGKTIEEAKRWWHDDGSVHCKNIFMRNHKGNQHYLICFPCDDDLAIHDIEHWLKEVLMAQGQNSPGKLSFASPERMMKYLGLEPGSVSPFGLINDAEHHVILFLDSRLKDAASLSFHPNDCRGTVVVSQEAFQKYLATIGNQVEYIKTN